MWTFKTIEKRKKIHGSWEDVSGHFFSHQCKERGIDGRVDHRTGDNKRIVLVHYVGTCHDCAFCGGCLFCSLRWMILGGFTTVVVSTWWREGLRFVFLMVLTRSRLFGPGCESVTEVLYGSFICLNVYLNYKFSSKFKTIHLDISILLNQSYHSWSDCVHTCCREHLGSSILWLCGTSFSFMLWAIHGIYSWGNTLWGRGRRHEFLNSPIFMLLLHIEQWGFLYTILQVHRERRPRVSIPWSDTLMCLMKMWC